jgi:hypothetical protein
LTAGRDSVRRTHRPGNEFPDRLCHEVPARACSLVRCDWLR